MSDKTGGGFPHHPECNETGCYRDCAAALADELEIRRSEVRALEINVSELKEEICRLTTISLDLATEKASAIAALRKWREYLRAGGRMGNGTECAYLGIAASCATRQCLDGPVANLPTPIRQGKRDASEDQSDVGDE